MVCAYNAADTLEDCLQSLMALRYPTFEIIVINDGSSDATGTLARRFERVRVIDVENGGLASARNIGAAYARGQIVAYTDADVRVDRDWLTFLVRPFERRDVVAAGGPNVVPPDDPFVAHCVARAPGGPTHVMLDDEIAEHVPGAISRSVAMRCSTSAASIPCSCAPATTSMCAGACRRAAVRSRSLRQRWCGITIARPCGGTGGSKSGTARVRSGFAPSIRTSSAGRSRSGGAVSTARCPCCGRSPHRV